jgi:DNA-binding transcriptional LysR family regulator
LTQVGEAYLRDCVLLLSDLDKAEEQATSDISKASGVLRLGAPLSFGIRQLPKILSAYQSKFPDIRVDLNLLSRNVDPIKAGFDLLIHLWGPLPPSAIARKVTHSHSVACAAPGYLARHGTPEDPRELASHHCLIANFNGVRVDTWRFSDRNGDRIDCVVNGRFECNETSILRSASLAGEGIVFLPTYIVGEDIANGLLIPLFPEWKLLRQNIFAVYLAGRHVPARVRFFIDFMLQRWGDEPPWSAWQRNLVQKETWERMEYE